MAASAEHVDGRAPTAGPGSVGRESFGAEEGTTQQSGWTSAGGAARFAWVHMPVSAEVRGAAVLCSPLLAEEYHAHRALLLLAERLAMAGFAAVRFDYTGTGDSTGRSEEVGDVGRWVDDIGATIDLARSWGAKWVAAVGMRAAANLLAGVKGPDAVVLWDPVRSGRDFVRQITLLHRAATAIAACPDEESLAGYRFPAGFSRSLSGVPGVSPPGVPALVLTRDGSYPSGWEPTATAQLRDAPQQAEMLEVSLHQSRVPVETLGVITDWLNRACGETEQVAFRPSLSARWSSGDVEERTQWVGVSGGRPMFGVATHPVVAPATSTCVVMFNSGAQSHIGPHRLHVDLARSLAQAGVRSLRVDLPGRGDSPESRQGQVQAFVAARDAEIDAIVDAGGDGPVVALGLCTGAWDALDAARRAVVRGALCINLGAGPAFTPGSVLDRDGGGSLRRIAAERLWLRWLLRSEWGTKLVWHLPGPLWWALGRTGVQPDASRAVAAVVRDGTKVALLSSRHELENPRLWSCNHGTRGRWSSTTFVGDVDLAAASGREAVADTCRALVGTWSAVSPSKG